MSPHVHWTLAERSGDREPPSGVDRLLRADGRLRFAHSASPLGARFEMCSEVSPPWYSGIVAPRRQLSRMTTRRDLAKERRWTRVDMSWSYAGLMTSRLISSRRCCPPM